MPDPALHHCDVGEERELDSGLHYDACGPAILSCIETEGGALWVSNYEYESRVNFCPFCGFKARQPIVFGEQS